MLLHLKRRVFGGRFTQNGLCAGLRQLMQNHGLVRTDSIQNEDSRPLVEYELQIVQRNGLNRYSLVQIRGENNQRKRCFTM